MKSTARVLDGIRVLDFGRFISAPYCGMILADMGAEVIRVERPGGEDDRRIGLTGTHGENFTFASLARNKKGITLDVTRKNSRQVLNDLVPHSDVFLHNYSPDAIVALRLTYDDLRSMKPDIIYAGISCYGSDGPYSHRTGFDPIAQVSSGAAALTGFDEDVPMRCGVPWVDYSTGLCAALGIVLALRHRDSVGEGQAVDCALLQTAVSCTAPMIAEAVIIGQERPRLGNRAAYLGPCDLYRCLDGYVYVAPVTRRAWCELSKVTGHAELACSAEFSTDRQLFERRAHIDPLIAHWMAQRTTQEIVSALEAAHVPCGVYRTTAQVADDPQVRAWHMLDYVDLEAPGLHGVPVSGVPVRLSKTPGAVVRRPPLVGEHNHAIYRQLLGYTSEYVDALALDGIV